VKILVLGASGRVGSCFTQAALSAGHQVVAFVRDPTRLNVRDPALCLFQGDAEDPEALENAVLGVDLVVSALGPRQLKAPITLMSDALLFILDAMQREAIARIMCVIGTGILQETPDRLKMDAPGFPAFLRPLAEDYLRMYALLDQSLSDWTLVCAPTLLERVRTGQVRVEANYLPADGLSLGIDDLVDFLLSEIQTPHFLRQRVGVAH
jgi:putative NADH-flavin reductase